MQSLARLISRPDVGGEPLPGVFRMLVNHDVIFRRGEMALVAAPPGGAKTAFALALARKLRVPTLYFCPDSSATTILVRLICAETGRSRAEVEHQIEIDPAWA